MSGLDREMMAKGRDAKLRFRILQLLEASRAVPFTASLDVYSAFELADDVQKFEDEDHYLRLLMDLSDEGYIELQDTRTLRTQAYSVKYLNVRIRARGVRFVAKAEPPDPLIDDGRIVKK
ncbi:MAG: hypothetical protein ACM359_06785 [Bacillota bacterium]